MSERCEECGRVYANYSDGDVGSRHDLCFRKRQSFDYYDNGQNEDCATYPLRSRIAQLEAVVEAQAKVIEWGDELHWQAIGTTIAKEYIKSYDAAKAELEKVR